MSHALHGRPVTRPAGRAAVLGSPIAHSKSPVLHRAAYAALGLGGWRYDAYEVDEQSFEPWFAEARRRTHQHGDVPGWAGLSLTMPLKRVVIPLVDRVDPLAGAVAAVNTVVFDEDGAATGYNTDVYGIVAALGEVGVTRVESAAVIGSGATAASAISALQLVGCSRADVYARSVERAGEVQAAGAALGAPPSVHPLAELPAVLDVDVVICTLPPTAADQLGVVLAGNLASARDRGQPVPALLDVVYAPWPTALATVWERHGTGRVVGGSAMLLHQAAAQVELMTGLKAPVAAMREALPAR